MVCKVLESIAKQIYHEGLLAGAGLAADAEAHDFKIDLGGELMPDIQYICAICGFTSGSWRQVEQASRMPTLSTSWLKEVNGVNNY